MKKLVLLIFLTVVVIFIGCGGVDSKSSGEENVTKLTKVTKKTPVSYDKVGRVTNENDVTYIYDKNGNIVSIKGGNQ